MAFEFATGLTYLEVGVNTIIRLFLLCFVAVLVDNARQLRVLRALLPICSYCKRIRDHQGAWHNLEIYITEHTASVFSHGICPECYEAHLRPQLDQLDAQPLISTEEKDGTK